MSDIRRVPVTSGQGKPVSVPVTVLKANELEPGQTVVVPADEQCDRCSATGKLHITIVGGGELVFCGHHANKYAPDLEKIAVKVTLDPEFEPDFEWRGKVPEIAAV